MFYKQPHSFQLSDMILSAFHCIDTCGIDTAVAQYV